MKVTSIMLGVVGAVLLTTSLITVMFFSLDSAMVYGKVSLGLAMVLASLILNWEGVKDGVNKKNTAFIISSIIMSLALLAVAGAGNYLAQAHKKQWDLTKDKVFTLADQSQKLLGGLNDDVIITAFYRKDDPEGDALNDLVGRYRLYSERVHLELINPETHPDKVEKYKVTEQGSRIIVEARGQEARIKEITEEAVTNAIIQVSQKEKKKLYMTLGHGESAVDSEEADGLKTTVADLAGEGYTVDTVNLVENQTIPADAALLAIIGQKQALLAPEARLVKEYVDKGGRLLLMVEPGITTGLEDLLKEYGMELGNNTVLDATEFGRLLGQGPDTAVVMEYAEHPSVKDLAGAASVFKSARSVSEIPAQKGVAVTALAKTSARTWGESDIGGGEWQWDVGEIRGPVTVAAAATLATTTVADKRSDEARLTVVGDAELAGNQYRTLANNRDFLLNLVAWTAEAEDRISIRPKSRAASRILMQPSQASMVAFFALDVMPVSLLSLGLAVWLVRRRR